MSAYSLLDTIKTSLFGLGSSSKGATEGTTIQSEFSSERKSERLTVEEPFRAVFPILDKLPYGNQAAALQSLVELGSLFPDAHALAHFRKQCPCFLY